MKVLILSKEAWRNEQNGGNVLSNIFNGFEAEFAQIYCTDAKPSNNICKNYYQMTDKMMVNNIIKRAPIGKSILYKTFPHENIETEAYSYVKKFNIGVIRIIRELVWKLARWNNASLQEFVIDFDPDIVFAPCYGNNYMLKLTRLVADMTKSPVISYISDDFYSNKNLSFSPLALINHFILRKNTRKTFPYYSLVYTMTDEQKEQCERAFGANVKILRKSGTFEYSREKEKVNAPIKMIYAGNAFLNRWKTLALLSDAIRQVNGNDEKIRLDIYTNTDLPKEAYSKLNDGKACELHNVVGLDELRKLYQNSDIAIHAEGFDKKSINAVRLSFSTKIVDCLDSGCAVMAICDSKQAGFAYLKRNDAAICIDNTDELFETINQIVLNPNILIDYQKKAFALGRKNHSEEKIKEGLLQDFDLILKKGKL